jgi:hypothetical protein
MNGTGAFKAFAGNRKRNDAEWEAPRTIEDLKGILKGAGIDITSEECDMLYAATQKYFEVVNLNNFHEVYFQYQRQLLSSK